MFLKWNMKDNIDILFYVWNKEHKLWFYSHSLFTLKRLTSDEVVSYLKADDAQYDECRQERIQQKEVLCIAWGGSRITLIYDLIAVVYYTWSWKTSYRCWVKAMRSQRMSRLYATRKDELNENLSYYKWSSGHRTQWRWEAHSRTSGRSDNSAIGTPQAFV